MVSEIRTSDGFVNATKMCHTAGKHFADFMRCQRTSDFLNELAKQLDANNRIARNEEF
jgi:CelD/BcsL family acetyltransferase involved in cellulose biosynthesis